MEFLTMKKLEIISIFIDPFKAHPLKAHIEYKETGYKDPDCYQMLSFTIDYRYDTTTLNIELELQSFKILYNNLKDRDYYKEIVENPSEIMGLLSDYIYQKDKNYLTEMLSIRLNREHAVIYSDCFEGHLYREKDYTFSILEYINKIL